MLKGTFSFQDLTIVEVTMTPQVHIRMEKVGDSVSKVYFVDEESGVIAIPIGIVITDMTHYNVVKPVEGLECYMLCWTDNYSVTNFGHPVITLMTRRRWAIIAPDEIRVKHIVQ